jgi:hypothetical protein
MQKIFNDILLDSTSYSLSEYDEWVLNGNGKAMHNHVEEYEILEGYIQKNLRLNKKFFNHVLKLDPRHLNLIAEPWSKDVSVVLPLLRAIVAINEHIKVSIYIAEQNEELLNWFLPDGSRSLPLLFGVDGEMKEAFRWGPRSKRAGFVLDSAASAASSVHDKALQEFYKSDLTMDIQEEWLEIFR